MSFRWERVIQEGEQLLKEGAFSEAAKKFEKALREAEKIGDGEMRVDSLQLLAMAHLECGFKAQAEQEAVRAAEITKRLIGETSRDHGQSLQFLADILIDMDELERAEGIAIISSQIIQASVISHDCDSCRAALMGVYTLQLEIWLRQSKFDQSRECLRQMWKNSSSDKDFEEPQQDLLNKMLKEFEESRRQGKSWKRLDRNLA